MSPRRPQSDAGFTLVEALVSLFVFGIISAGCVVMLSQSAFSQKQVSRSHAALSELATARALFESDLAQIVGRQTREADGNLRPRFIGGDADTALAFVRASADPDPNSGASTSLTAVEYVIKDDQVIRRSRAYLDAVPDTPTNDRVVFATAENAHFEFYDGAAWNQSYLSAAQGQPMPRAVALIATLPRYGEIRLEARLGVQP